MKPQHARTAPAARAAELACLTVAIILMLFATLLAVAPTARAASGDLAWQRHVVGPNNGYASFTALAPAPAGGVFVAGGMFDPSSDYLTVRYTPAGKRPWLRTLDFSLHAFDSIAGAASDRRGDVIVAGEVNYPSLSQMEAIVKYGPGGKRAWTRYYNDSHAGQETQLATDASGDIYVSASTAGNDIALIKYSPSGTRRWVRTYAQPGDDQPTGLATDAAGNVYLTGFSFGTASQYDIVTLKYAANGHRRWVRRWNGPASGDDYGYGIAVTRAGVVYVAGQSTATSTAADAIVLKYSTKGILAWARSFSSTGAFADSFSAIALLGNGDVAATGYTSLSTPQQDVLTARLSPAGHTRWRRAYDGPDGLADQGLLVAGGPGAVYVAGTSDGATTGTDVLTLKYSGTGQLRWARRHTSAGANADFPSGLLVTGGGVYVAGSETSATADVARLLKYKP